MTDDTRQKPQDGRKPANQRGQGGQNQRRDGGRNNQQSQRRRGNGRQNHRYQKKNSSGLRIAILATVVAASCVVGYGLSAFDKAGLIEILKESDSPDQDKTATSGISKTISAVVSALPSVAILGEKDGPAGTTEVFIQVPGVLNMQSVYVLDDNKTVISGVIVGPLSGAGFPGVDLSRPTGEATVDPNAPRKNTQEMINMLGGVRGEGGSNSAPALPDANSREVPQPDAKRAYKESVSSANVPSPSLRDSRPDDQPKQNRASSGEAPAVPVPEPTSNGSTSDSVDTASTAESAKTKEPAVLKVRNDGEPMVFESLDSMVGSEPFGRVVRKILKADGDIDDVRTQDGPTAKQDAYFDLVRRLPSITQGDGPRDIYVMFDPNCPVCKRYYSQVSRDVLRDQVTVHWIPAIVFPDARSSISVSAALIAEVDRSGDALGMLDRVMTEPGYTEKLDASDRVAGLVPYVESVAKNTSIMAMAKAETPLLVFRTKDGGLSVSGGIPPAGYIDVIGVDG